VLKAVQGLDNSPKNWASFDSVPSVTKILDAMELDLRFDDSIVKNCQAVRKNIEAADGQTLTEKLKNIDEQFEMWYLITLKLCFGGKWALASGFGTLAICGLSGLAGIGMTTAIVAGIVGCIGFTVGHLAQIPAEKKARDLSLAAKTLFYSQENLAKTAEVPLSVRMKW